MTTRLLLQPSEVDPPERFANWLTGAAVSQSGQLDPAHLEQVHEQLAQVWQPVAARFVALAAGEPVRGQRPSLPLL